MIFIRNFYVQLSALQAFIPYKLPYCIVSMLLVFSLSV